MPRTLVFLAISCCLGTVAGAQNAAPPLSAVFSQSHTQNKLLHSLGVSDPRRRTPFREYCCKTCTVGKACGNTCISRDKTCHVGSGCACDG